MVIFYTLYRKLDETTMIDTLSVYRREQKYLISYPDAAKLKTRLSAFLRLDEHGEKGVYRVKSLYYDTPDGKDYREKLDGLEQRQKLRLRIYDEKQPGAKLELKSKNGNLQHKTSLQVSRTDAEILAKGIYTPLFSYDGEEAMRLYAVLSLHRYRPAVIIEYDRTAFYYREFDVRLTFDSHIRSSEINLNLYERQLSWNPVFRDAVILEVKFNEALPRFIQKLLQPYHLTAVSFSKYCCGRSLVGSYLI